MDRVTVGIDVSKDRLDVALRPSGEAFVVERNAAGLDLLIRVKCIGQAPRENTRLESIGGIVDTGHCFLEILEGEKVYQGSEDLL